MLPTFLYEELSDSYKMLCPFSYPRHFSLDPGMNLIRLARYLVQTITLAIFGYQMNVALEKYFAYRSVPTVESKDIESAKLPEIYVCRKNSDQFHSNFHGYSFSSFLQGSPSDVDYPFITWEGKHNVSYENITQYLYNPIESVKLSLMGSKPVDPWYQVFNNKAIYFSPFDGYCLRIEIPTKNISESEQFYARLSRGSFVPGNLFQVFLADPDINLYYRINPETMTGDPIEAEEKLSKVYSMYIEEVHWMPNNDDCTAYGEAAAFKTYADCVANYQDEELRPILGCSLPWLAAPGNPNSCTGRQSVPDPKWDRLFEPIDILASTNRLSILGFSTPCQRPCVEVKVRSRLNSVAATMGKVEVELHFPQQVKVTRYILAYGIFDLVVEGGSSLGLWIGLSGLGVFDLLVDVALLCKTKIWGTKTWLE